MRLPKPPPASSPPVRAVMQGNRAVDTRPEVAVRSELHRRGLRFRKHVQPVATLRCQADVVFPRERIAVFVDGCWWHGCPQHGTRPKTNSEYWDAKLDRNLARDGRNNRLLSEAGWTVVRAWEHEPASEVADRVAETVRGRRKAPLPAPITSSPAIRSSGRGRRG